MRERHARRTPSPHTGAEAAGVVPAAAPPRGRRPAARRRPPTATGPLGERPPGRTPMDATRDRASGPGPGLTELEAMCVWTAARLHALTWAALLGRGYDPDVFDIALLTHRAACACAAAARRPDCPPATGAARGVASGGSGGSGGRGPR